MNKIDSEEECIEACRTLTTKERLFVNVAVISALTVMIPVAAPSILNLEHRSVGQDQTASDEGKLAEDLSFEIDIV
jgi:hypothetical protein